MNNYFLGLGLLLLLTGLSACFNNEDDGPMPPQGTINFGGFILTDENGQRTSGIDPNDWRLDVVFNRDEIMLYSLNLKPLCASSEGTVIDPAFPNPFEDVLSLRIENPDGAAMDMVVTDRNYQPQLLFNPVLLGEDSVAQFQLDMRALPADIDTLRLYYVLAKGDCTLRGYGDLLRQ